LVILYKPTQDVGLEPDVRDRLAIDAYGVLLKARLGDGLRESVVADEAPDTVLLQPRELLDRAPSLETSVHKGSI